MAIFNIFRTRKPRSFNYQPLYYNERKEKLQQRIQEIEKEMQARKNGTYTSNISKGFIKKHEKRDKRSSNIRLLIILLILLAFFYFMIY